MKSTITLSALILGLTITPSVFGQLRIGLRGGLNGTHMADQSGTLEARHYRRGLFGLIIEYELSSKVAVQFGPMISQKGGHLIELRDLSPAVGPDPKTGELVLITGTLTLDSKYALDYIDLPLLFKYDLLTGSIRPYVTVGPWLAINISASVLRRTLVERHYMTENSSRREDSELQPNADKIGDYVRHIDAGIITGLGAETTLSKIDWFISVEYVHGVTNMVEEPLTFGSRDLANRGLYVITGVTIPVGRRK